MRVCGQPTCFSGWSDELFYLEGSLTFLGICHYAYVLAVTNIWSGNNVLSIFGSMNLQLQGTDIKLAIETSSSDSVTLVEMKHSQWELSCITKRKTAIAGENLRTKIKSEKNSRHNSGF